MSKLAKLLALLILCGACTRTIYLPVESTVARHDTVRIVALRADTVRLSDTLRLEQHGDTVICERIHWRERIATRTDTLWREHNDTIREVRTVSPVVDASPSGRSFLWPALAGLFLLIIILLVICLRRK